VRFNSVIWNDLTLPPINLNNMPCALWFYNKEYYDKHYLIVDDYGGDLDDRGEI